MPESPTQAAGRASDEEAWVERARAGDTDAYRKLVERHQDRAYGLALRMLGSPADAEEVAQDGFVRAWRALPGFHGEARFSTWLYRIVARCALDRSAKLARRRSRETVLDEAAAMEAPPDRGAGATERAQRLERMLEALSQVQRAVVVLYYYEDRSVEEVARTMGIPAGTVKTHLHRARAQLRKARLEVEGERGAG